MSMNPGATTRPDASIVRAAVFPFRSPMAAIFPPRIPTSARNHGLPVPSTTLPRCSSRSKSCALATVDTMAAQVRRLATRASLRTEPELRRDATSGPFVSGHIIANLLAQIDLARTRDLLVTVVQQLFPLGKPSHGTADRKQHREHLGG